MLELKPANFEQFEREAQRGNVVPVVRTVLADLHTPVGAFLRIAGDAEYAFLLESIEGGERVARYSFIGANPWMIVRGRGERTIVECDGTREEVATNAVDFVRDYFAKKKLARRPGLDSVDLRSLYEAAVAETARIEAALSNDAGVVASAGQETTDTTVHFQSNWPRQNFEAAVETVKQYIAAGDCYQVVIAQQFTKPTPAAPLAIYRALRATNPSPYMYFLRLGAEAIIGASPEMLVRCHGQRLDYRPIAGTRKRGATEAEDWMLGEEMRNDEKEVAEHTMLVDLGRNDLGRVSDYGSVRVEELMGIERYSHVQHLVTRLRARLRDDLDRFDALGSCFPAGTVTGAPKIRAMQIIRELEPSPRAVYAGAILYVDYANNLDSCIAIRTMDLRNGVATVEAGAGIPAASVPA